MQVLDPFKLFILGQLIIAIFWALDLSLRPYIVKMILNDVTNFDQYGSVNAIIYHIIQFITLTVISAWSFGLSEWVMLNYQPNLKQHIENVMLNRLLDQSHTFYQHNFTGSIISKINDIRNGIPYIVNMLIDRLFSNSLALVVALYTVSLVDIKFTIALILCIIIFLVF